MARALGGSCSTPLGSFAHLDTDGTLTVHAVLGDSALGALLDNSTPASSSVGTPIRHTASARVTDIDAAEALGLSVAEALLDSGGRRYLPAT